jgi:hypothetical protein
MSKDATSEVLEPGVQRRITIFAALLEAGLPPAAFQPLADLVAGAHVSGCYCEPLCLDDQCDCADDAHTDPDCYRLRDALFTAMKARADKLGVR